MLPLARVYWEVEGKVMVYATVKKILQMKPAFGVYLHSPPLELESPTLDLGPGTLEPDLRIECNARGHFTILQGDLGNNPVKVATVKKDNLDIKENFPLHIQVAEKVDRLFVCLVIGAVHEINVQAAGAVS